MGKTFPGRLPQDWAPFIGIDPERPKFAVQRGALHADELGRARDVAAESVDLSEQIFALENLPRVA
jgi:hypothetical protein